MSSMSVTRQRSRTSSRRLDVEPELEGGGTAVDVAKVLLPESFVPASLAAGTSLPVVVDFAASALASVFGMSAFGASTFVVDGGKVVGAAVFAGV